VEVGSWQLTGGVTFRAANVEIEKTFFYDSLAEDALNVVRSEFELRDVIFELTRSDALDADFSRGHIEGGRFASIGGDGIDGGGSQLVVRGTTMEDVHDKAVSIGEGSELHAVDLLVRRAGIGLASKDASRAVIEDSSLLDLTRVGLAAYVKKPVYGPARIEASRVRITTSGRETLAQTGSQIVLNGLNAMPQSLDVEAFYAEVEGEVEGGGEGEEPER
jgi:hypothetical protein